MIVTFFMLSTLPLKVVTFLNSACNLSITNNETLINCLIILSHVKPALNPLLYAYHLLDFRQAFLKHVGLEKLSESYKQPVELRPKTDSELEKNISQSQSTSVFSSSSTY